MYWHYKDIVFAEVIGRAMQALFMQKVHYPDIIVSTYDMTGINAFASLIRTGRVFILR